MISQFAGYLDKNTFDAVMTTFFRQAGYIDHNMTLEFKLFDLEEDGIRFEAELNEERVN